jgi:hypothetical protein
MDAGQITMWATYSPENFRMPVVLPRDADPHSAATRMAVMQQVSSSLAAKGLITAEMQPHIKMISACEELDGPRSTSCLQARLRGAFYSFQLCDSELKAVAPADRLLCEVYSPQLRRLFRVL